MCVQPGFGATSTNVRTALSNKDRGAPLAQGHEPSEKLQDEEDLWTAYLQRGNTVQSTNITWFSMIVLHGLHFGTARFCNVLFLQSLRRLLFLVKVSLKCLPSTLQADS